MKRYITVRLAQGILTLWVVTIVVFGLTHATGNPLDVLLPLEARPEDYARVSKQWGLDQPLHVQYLTYMGKLLTGDFGESWKWPPNKAMNLALERFPATLQLGLVSLGIATLMAIPLGVLAAVKKNSLVDHVAKLVALLGQSLPAFWIGIVLMWIFGVQLRWVPTSGMDGASSFILPAIALGWYQVAAMTLLLRSSMLEVLDSQYVKLARIKGLKEWEVVLRHCLPNAAIAPLTYFGIIAGVLLSGSVVIETVFSWPGVGRLAVDAVRARDFQVVQAVVLLFAAIFIVVNMLVDILYAYIDPRIRYTD